MFLILFLTKEGKEDDVKVGTTDKCVGQTTLCIDTRFQAPMQKHFKSVFGTPYFNNYIVPGVSLALLGTLTWNPSGATAVGGGIASNHYMRGWVSSMAVARTLHSISTISFMDHEDCGYFKAFFSGTPGLSYTTAVSPPYTPSSFASGQTYAALTSLQQKQVHTYYLEQLKVLYGNGLLNQTTGTTGALMTDIGGTFVSSQNFTGVTLRTYYIDLQGNINETGVPKVCT